MLTKLQRDILKCAEEDRKLEDIVHLLTVCEWEIIDKIETLEKLGFLQAAILIDGSIYHCWLTAQGKRYLEVSSKTQIPSEVFSPLPNSRLLTSLN